MIEEQFQRFCRWLSVNTELLVLRELLSLKSWLTRRARERPQFTTLYQMSDIRNQWFDPKNYRNLETWLFVFIEGQTLNAENQLNKSPKSETIVYSVKSDRNQIQSTRNALNESRISGDRRLSSLCLNFWVKMRNEKYIFHDVNDANDEHCDDLGLITWRMRANVTIPKCDGLNSRSAEMRRALTLVEDKYLFSALLRHKRCQLFD